MERQALAAKTGAQVALAAIGTMTVVFLLVASDYRSVTDVLALVALVAVPTAVAADVARDNLEELRG